MRPNMSIQSWLLFCVTEIVLCFTPGPAVLLVVSLALTRGATAGFKASLGILSANAMYFIISATSIGALLLASWELFTIVKWCGAAYLIWSGARMILFAKHTAAVDGRGAEAVPSRFGSLASGFVTQAANPKALVFFTAILPQFINPTGPLGIQLFVLGTSSILIELLVLGIYTGACHQSRGWVRQSQFARPLERAGGALLIGAGAGLAASDWHVR
jgi:threonine/homoserine/homoserine lactone efflux protein